MDNQIIINLKEDGTIKNIETTKEQELQSIIKFKEDCLNEYATRINKAMDLISKAIKNSEINGNGTINLNELYDILGGE